MKPLRVVIADDHPFYRKGLVRSLRADGIDVVGEVPNGAAAIRAVGETEPDLVVMDLNMPGMSGADATRRLTQLAPRTPVLMLSVSAEEDDVAESILAGATGYVLKDGPVEEVITAIREAAAGRPVVSARLATVLLQRVSARTRREVRSPRLSPAGP